MKIEPQIELVELSASGRELTLKDSTEYEVEAGIVGAVLTLQNPFLKRKESYLHIDSNTIPNIEQVTNGTPFKVNSVLTHDSDISEGLLQFADGILSINYYPYTTTITASGEKGKHFIIGENLDNILMDYEAVIIEGKVYKLDKSKPTNGGTVLYTVEEIEEDFTSFKPAYRAALYVNVNTMVKQVIAEGAIALAYPHNRKDGLKEAVNKLIHNYMASKIWFDTANYDMVDLVTRENYQIVSLYRLGRC